MKKSDLRVGDVVKIRAGMYLVIMPNHTSDDGLCTYATKVHGCHHYLTYYNEDLTCYDASCDIVAVYKASEPHKVYGLNAIDQIITGKIEEHLFDKLKWDWVRPEPIKEVTMADLEKMYGCKVKIVNAK